MTAWIDQNDLDAARRERERFVVASRRRRFEMPAPLADIDARIAWAHRSPGSLDAFQEAIALEVTPIAPLDTGDR